MVGVRVISTCTVDQTLGTPEIGGATLCSPLSNRMAGERSCAKPYTYVLSCRTIDPPPKLVGNGQSKGHVHGWYVQKESWQSLPSRDNYST